MLEPLLPDTTEKSAWGEEDAVGVGEDAEAWVFDVEGIVVIVEFGRGLVAGVGVVDVVLGLTWVLTAEVRVVSMVLEFAWVLLVEIGVVSMTLGLDGALINVVGDTALVSEVADATAFDVETLDVFLKLAAVLEVISELALALALEVEIVCVALGLARVLFSNALVADATLEMVELPSLDVEEIGLVSELAAAPVVSIRVLDGNSTTARVLSLEMVPDPTRVLTADVDIFDVASKFIGVLECDV